MNTEPIKAAKKTLRTALLAERKAFGGATKRQYDKWICQEIGALIEAKNYQVVHAYIPIANEIDIAPLLRSLLEKGVTVVCPKTLPQRQLENRVLHSLQDLEVGIMKTLHPKSPEIYDGSYDLILVPGLAFDDQNYRLGYGGGYYDTFLKQQPTAFKLGIFYPFQHRTQVPISAHDVPLDKILWREF